MHVGKVVFLKKVFCDKQVRHAVKKHVGNILYVDFDVSYEEHVDVFIDSELFEYVKPDKESAPEYALTFRCNGETGLIDSVKAVKVS